MKDLSLRLAPQAVITGRIVDDKNEPVASASVRTMRYSYQMGKRQLLPTGNAVTNDLGGYRIHSLAPGGYYLRAVRVCRWHQPAGVRLGARNAGGGEYR